MVKFSWRKFSGLVWGASDRRMPREKSSELPRRLWGVTCSPEHASLLTGKTVHANTKSEARARLKVLVPDGKLPSGMVIEELHAR